MIGGGPGTLKGQDSALEHKKSYYSQLSKLSFQTLHCGDNSHTSLLIPSLIQMQFQAFFLAGLLFLPHPYEYHKAEYLNRQNPLKACNRLFLLPGQVHFYHRSRVCQACALGSAMAAAVVAGVHKNLPAAQEAMGGGFETEYHPDPQRAGIYSRLYQKYQRFGRFVEFDASHPDHQS